THPMKPVRLKLTAELMRAYGLFDRYDVKLALPRLATDEELALAHDPEYIGKVRELSDAGAGGAYEPGWGLGTGDNPVFPGMHEASASIAGGSLAGAELVMSGEVGHAFHFGGGLHHAQRRRASGFCVYNDAAIAIAWLRQARGVRVLYLDVDAHHGDGVQNLFYSDPGVLTISIHESGRHLFPGTGFPDESGEGEGRGYSVNLPLEPFTGDETYLNAFNELVPPLARAFAPDIIVTQNGCDSHFSDPLAHLSLTMAGFKALAAAIHGLVHEFSGGRWLALGGGGYEAYSVVPRAWTLIAAGMAGVELKEEIPEAWREQSSRHASAEAPLYLTRETVPPPDPQAAAVARRAADAALDEVRENIFPLLGAV
ncbi:MAG: acetoin utilization protein AcuC, partial [Actinomycetota bacterium]